MWSFIFIVSLIRRCARALSYVALPARISSRNFRQREWPDSPLATRHDHTCGIAQTLPAAESQIQLQISAMMLLRVPQSVATADLRFCD